MTTQLQTLQFNRQSLITFEQNGTYYTAMKPICENIGLAWESQLTRIKRDEVLSEGMIVMITPTNGGNQQMVCLPIEYINGWLFGIDIKRCKPEIRETLIMYKKECYQALYNYWHKNEPTPIALPEPEKKFTREFTEYELQQLVWLWFAFKRGVGTFQHIEKAFRALGSNMSGQIYGQAYEYLSVLRSTNQILNRITKDFEIDPMTNWRALEHLRQFDPKAVKIDF